MAAEDTHLTTVEATDAPAGTGREDWSRYVDDSGPGVPEDARRRIFTTKPVGVSTGLGLDISHRIVHGHGGSLVLCDGAGPTTFRVRLPRGG